MSRLYREAPLQVLQLLLRLLCSQMEAPPHVFEAPCSRLAEAEAQPTANKAKGKGDAATPASPCV